MEKSSDFRHIYCLFCRTGVECRICEDIYKKFPDVYSLVAMKEKHRIINKHDEIDRQVFLPGYLFLYSKDVVDFDSLIRMDDIYRILGNEAGAHELLDSDRSFAEWLLRNDGLIGISRITNRNNRITIKSGPMKYFAKKIVRIDKHTKNALVRMDFLGTQRDMWLAFEFDDEVTDKNREEYSNEE